MVSCEWHPDILEIVGVTRPLRRPGNRTCVHPQHELKAAGPGATPQSTCCKAHAGEHLWFSLWKKSQPWCSFKREARCFRQMFKHMLALRKWSKSAAEAIMSLLLFTLYSIWSSGKFMSSALLNRSSISVTAHVLHFLTYVLCHAHDMN